MPEAYELLPYSIKALKDLLVRQSQATDRVIEGKYHSEYFEEYFEQLEAKAIIVENEYVDRDFLEDFSGYYARCFHPYDRMCTRLHFFRHVNPELTEERFAAILADGCTEAELEELNDGYLGFIVVKPLPKTVIGRTCLRTYDENKNGGYRNYPIKRNYDVHLFGIALSVESLAFQEQDKVAAACATNALWSAFQGTGKLFQHHIPSPIEITRRAGEHWFNKTRLLPSKGLTVEQMAFVVRHVGLEPHAVSCGKGLILLKATVSAYLRGHVPVLLVLGLDVHPKQGPTIHADTHAVAVTGYSSGSGEMLGYGKSQIPLLASRIDELYAHDDGVGPFARMPFVKTYLETSLRHPEHPDASVTAHPTHVLIPLYHKIRIPFADVLVMMQEFHSILVAISYFNADLPIPLAWDIHLTTVGEYKQSLFLRAPRGSGRQEVLTRPMPRFLWRAAASDHNGRLLDILLDATDIPQSDLVSLVVSYNQTLPGILGGLERNEPLREEFEDLAAWAIMKRLQSKDFILIA